MRHLLSGQAGTLSYGAPELHQTTGSAELIQNVRSYTSTLLAVHRNINAYWNRHAGDDDADS
jgi:hypothetical protein